MGYSVYTSQRIVSYSWLSVIHPLKAAELEERTMKREARIAKSRAKADRLRAEATNAAEMNDTRPIKRRRKADVA
jgi:hypothetical protein